MSQYSDTIEMEWDGESVESNGDLLRPLATESASQSEILGLDGNTLGMDGSQVSVLEERHEVSLSSLLESHDGRGLETQVGLEILSDLTNETLERELADQKLSRLLITSDFTESDGSRAESVRLLDTTSCSSGCGLPGGLGGKLLTRSLSSSGFAGGLFSTGH